MEELPLPLLIIRGWHSMEWALHIRSLDQLKDHRYPWRWTEFYDAASEASALKPPECFGHIYLGDEFCPHRLPSLQELHRVIEFTQSRSLSLTLITPMVSDAGLENCRPLLDTLSLHDQTSEIVVNDWGMMTFVQQNYPHFRLALGRLLNKGFKDPRLQKTELLADADIFEFFNQSTYRLDVFHRMALSFKINRLERDLLPYEDIQEQDTQIPSHHVQNYSYYLPWGYITTGRICLSSNYSSSAASERSFLPCPDSCDYQCAKFSLQLRNKHFHTHLLQAGNTIFFPYSYEMCRQLISLLQTTSHRLVYQGLLV